MSDETTLTKLNDYCIEMFTLKEEAAELEKQRKEKNKKLEQIKLKVKEILEAANLNKFNSPAGLVSSRIQTSVKIKDKYALFEYLKKRGYFDAMITVNSRTLKGYFKTEKDIADSQGEFDFTIPGIEYTEYEDLTLRRK